MSWRISPCGSESIKHRIAHLLGVHSKAKCLAYIGQSVGEGLISGLKTKGSDNMAKIHVLADESLGGVKREYIEVDRKAEVGERVIIVENESRGFEEGFIGTVSRSGVGFVWIDGKFYQKHEEYRVLIPVESDASPQSTDDLIANLARRVAQLERELTGAKRDIETWAQEVVKLKYEPKPSKITLDADVLARILGGERVE